MGHDTPNDELPGMLAVAKGIAEQKWPHTMDAMAWADEFVKLNPGADHGLMLTWFANAIMAGYDTAQSRAAPSETAPRLVEGEPGVPTWRREVQPSDKGDCFIDARLDWIEQAARKGLPSPSRDELAAFHDGYKAAFTVEPHVDGRWCKDRQCARCYSAPSATHATAEALARIQPDVRKIQDNEARAVLGEIMAYVTTDQRIRDLIEKRIVSRADGKGDSNGS